MAAIVFTSIQKPAQHRLRCRSGSIPHDLVTADRQPPRYSLLRPPRRRRCSSSSRSARSARSRTTNATRAAVRSFTAARSSNLRANTIAASTPIQTSHASRRAQIPIACAAPTAHDRSQFRALALFGRRPIKRVAAIVVFTGIQKPAHSTQHTSGSEEIVCGARACRPLPHLRPRSLRAVPAQRKHQ